MARPLELELMSNSDVQSGEPSCLEVYVAKDDKRKVQKPIPSGTTLYFSTISSHTPSIARSEYEMNLEPIPEKQKLGYLSVASLIINNMVGVGKY